MCSTLLSFLHAYAVLAALRVASTELFVSGKQRFRTYNAKGQKRKQPLHEFTADEPGIGMVTQFLQECVWNNFPGQEKTTRTLVHVKS